MISQMHESLKLRHFGFGGGGGAKIFRPMKMVLLGMIIVFMRLLG